MLAINNFFVYCKHFTFIIMFKFVKILFVTVVIFACCKNENYHKGKCKDWSTIKESVNLPDSLKFLTPVFNQILNDDRKYRCSPNPDYFSEHITEQQKLDSVNQIMIIDIIKKYGFKGPQQFGMHGYFAFVKVMQHSRKKIQEYIYPLYVKAFKDSCLGGPDLALFEDRINVHRNRMQYFGSQIRYDPNNKEYLIYPLYNADSISFYRKQIGMTESFEDYLMNNFKIKWDAEKYKKELPALRQRLGFTDSVGVYYKSPLPDFIKVDSSLLK